MSSSGFLNQLLKLEDLGDKRVVCLAAYLTTDTNSKFLDKTIDELESKFEDYGKRRSKFETKFENILHLYKYSERCRHRIIYKSNLHENLESTPHNFADLTQKINMLYSPERQSLHIRLEELCSNQM